MDTRAGAATRRSAPPSAPRIFIPRLGREIPFNDWFFQEMREGGRLKEYLAREKAASKQRHRAVARKHHGEDGFKQNNKSDLELKAVVPAREFFRWKAVDNSFWEDPSNIKSYLRDNPEAKP